MADERRQERRGTAAAWTSANPILADGEIGVVTDQVGKFKIGNGSLAWSALPFAGGEVSASQLAESETASRARANHTGTQAQSTITNLVTDLGAKALLSDTYTRSASDSRYVRTVNNVAPDGTGNVTVAGGTGGGGTVATIPAGSVLHVIEANGVYPARPTLRTDVMVIFKGPDQPPVGGNGGMNDVDEWHATS